MNAATARQWERIEYQAPIQVSVGGSSDAQLKTLHARAVNVSERGIQVRTDQPLPIGEVVTCSMLLEGRPTALAGRVRWARWTAPGFAQPGAGIEFDELSEADSGLLRHLVSRGARGDQPVDLFLPGMSRPVHARAFTSSRGLHITAALPVLMRDAPIEFQFHDEGPRFRGRIARVSIRERGRTPHIEVELAVHARETPRFRHYTMYDGVEDLAKVADDKLRVLPPPQTPPLPRGHAPTPLPDLPKSLAARVPRAALLGVIAIGAALIAMLTVWIVAAPSGLALRTAARPAPKGLAMSRRDATPPTASPATPPPTAAAAAARDDASAREASVQVVGDATEISVPIAGTLDGMRVVRWTSPVAVVVELPDAALAVAPGVSFPGLGHVSRLSLGQSGGVVRIRAFLDAPPLRAEAQLHEGQLVIRTEPDLRGQVTRIAQ